MKNYSRQRETILQVLHSTDTHPVSYTHLNMISAGDFRNGVTFEEDGNVLQVIEFQHVKPGKGAAFVRTKVKNVITGSVVEKSYNPTAKFPTAFVERKDMEYSYCLLYTSICNKGAGGCAAVSRYNGLLDIPLAQL